jgi:DNA ligase-1
MSLYTIIKELQNASGSNAKTAILKANKDNELLKAYLKAVYDPAISYYQTKVSKKLGWNLDWSDYYEENGEYYPNYYHILSQMEVLSTRELTGDKAKNYLNGFYASVSPESQELIELLIKRSIGAGVGDTMILKVFPDLWFSVGYQRCSLMDEKAKKKFSQLPEFYVELKCDGSFAYLVKNAAEPPQAVTRAGSCYPIDFSKEVATGLPDGFVAVGEMLVYEEGVLLDRKTGNGILNSVLKGGELSQNQTVKMTAWDCLTVEDFKAGVSARKYYHRIDLLGHITKSMPNVEVVERHLVNSLEEAYKIYSKFTSEGKEGAILKTTDFKWASGTSKDCIKLKIEFEVDLEVVAIHEGTGKASGMMGSIALRSSDGLIATDCGSGFSDSDRVDWWINKEVRIGSIVTVKANDIISKRDSKTASLFLPVFIEERLDKTEADSYARCVEQLEAAKQGTL